MDEHKALGARILGLESQEICHLLVVTLTKLLTVPVLQFSYL